MVESVWNSTMATLDVARNCGGPPLPQYVSKRLALDGDEPSQTVTESKQVESDMAGSRSKCSNVNSTFCNETSALETALKSVLAPV